MSNFDGCQLLSVAGIAEGLDNEGPSSPVRRFKRMLAKPWNYQVKPWLKKYITKLLDWKAGMDKKNIAASTAAAGTGSAQTVAPVAPAVPLQAGDWVRVRSKEEIQATLNAFKETKGCAFLPDMWQYCGTTHKVFRRMERFLDERDYKVKKTRGIVLLENVICVGTPVFGRCDRSCLLFWREEWLEKIDPPTNL